MLRALPLSGIVFLGLLAVGGALDAANADVDLAPGATAVCILVDGGCISPCPQTGIPEIDDQFYCLMGA